VTDWRHTTTAHLHLDIAAEGDEADLFAIHSDPDTWRHVPSGVHTDPAESVAMVGQSRRQFDEDGLGYATESARRAVEAAHEVAPDRVVLAYLLEHNVASRRTAEKIGLRLVWRGPDRPNPDPDAIRLVYLDRDPDEATLRAIEEAALG
jgi:hypothetical protein